MGDGISGFWITFDLVEERGGREFEEVGESLSRERCGILMITCCILACTNTHSQRPKDTSIKRDVPCAEYEKIANSAGSIDSPPSS